jgi:hypothetical protein
MPSTLFLRRGGPLRGWREFYPSFAGLGEPDRNCLLGILHPMLPFPHMMDFFADELACLGGGRLAFASILAGAFDGLSFGHSLLLKISLIRSLSSTFWRTYPEKDVKAAKSLGRTA